MILADLGAEVIKVEPVDGDRTRKLQGLRRRLLRLLQSQQEEPGARCRLARGPGGAGEAPAVGRRADRELRAGLDEQARAGARASGEDQSAAGLLRAERLPARAVRKAAGARRGRADDGRARLHDRPDRPAVARRHLGGRHRGRHVRRLRHGAGAEAARAHRQGRAGRERAVRIGGVPDGPASRHHRHERRAAAADARAGELVGDLRDLHHPTGSRCSSASPATASGSASASSSSQDELAADPQLATNNQRIEARPWLVPKVAETSSATARTSSRRSASKPTSPLRRSRGRRTCSTIRIF